MIIFSLIFGDLKIMLLKYIHELSFYIRFLSLFSKIISHHDRFNEIHICLKNYNWLSNSRKRSFNDRLIPLSGRLSGNKSIWATNPNTKICFPWQQDTLYDNTNLIWGFNPICPILFTSYINRYIRLALKTWLTFSLFREKNSRHLKRDITSLSLYSNVSLSEHDEHLRLMASQPHSQANIEKAILFQLNLNWIQLEKEMYHNWEFVE